MPTPGIVLKERYRVVRELKKGGQGNTFIVEDLHLPKHPEQVLKKLKTFEEIDPKQRDHYVRIQNNFFKEAEILEKVGKKSGGRVPELHAHFRDGDDLYMVQEFIKGKTLEELQAEKGRFGVAEVSGLLVELLGTLDYVHAFKLIHRDINPANVVVRENDGQPVLIDFGIVKELLDGVPSRQSSVAFGKPDYIPNEQMHGQPEYSSDLYGLGLTMIVLLTGESPKTMRNNRKGCFDWRRFAPHVDDGLAGVLDKATAFLCGSRYETAREMLEAVQAGSPKTARISVTPSQVPTAPAVIPPPLPPTMPASQPTVKGISSMPSQIVTPVLSTAEVSFSNAVGMEFVLIQPGKFLMGGDKYNSEKPIHEVTISRPFYLGIHQVTQAQWKAVMGGKNPSHFKGDDLPVEQVSWNNAKEFIKQLNAREKTDAYRLPSEAEWEYACRAGTTGDYAGVLEEMAWYYENSGDRRLNEAEWNVEKLDPNNCRTHPVGKKKPNKWGLYDMHGNVWEWCEDVWHADYNGAPTDGSAWTQGGNQGPWVLRGGAWDVNSIACRSACRARNGIGSRVSGFRVGCAVSTLHVPESAEGIPSSESRRVQLHSGDVGDGIRK